MKRFMYFRLLLLFVLIGVFSACAGHVAPEKSVESSKSHFASSWEAVDPMVRAKAKDYLNANYSMEIAVLRGGERHFYSFSKHKDEPLPDEHTFFGINSDTKVFVGLILAQMVTEKKLKLDDPVQKYFKQVKLPQFDGIPITFRSLVTQSSGLPFIPDNMGKVSHTDPYAKYTDRLLFKYLSHAKLDFEPGTKYQYSDTGFGLLGCVLAKIDHRKFSDMIEKRISKPLRLKDTHAVVDHAMEARLMLGHDSSDQALPPRSSSECMRGSWGIHSTASDLIQFLGYQLHPEKSPFPQAIKLSQTTSTILENEKTAIGFAWDVRILSGTHSKGGAGGGLSSQMYFNQNRDTALVVLSSSWPDKDEEGPGALGWDIFTDLR